MATRYDYDNQRQAKPAKNLDLQGLLDSPLEFNTKINNLTDPNSDSTYATTGPVADSPKDRAQRDRVRAQARGILRSAIASSQALTRADIAGFEYSMSEADLENNWGAQTHEDKMTVLHDSIQRIKQVIEEAKKEEREFNRLIGTAERKQWISSASAKKWKDRFANEVPWFQKESFLSSTFKAYYENWQNLHKDYEKAEGLRKKLRVKASDVPEVGPLQSGYLNQHFEERRNVVDGALGALAAYEKGWGALHKQAQGMLDGAAKRGALAKSKVGTWMRRIFESGASYKKIAAFINGQGPTHLAMLIGKWTEVGERFNNIESKSKDNEIIVKGFNFVSKGKFLEWHYMSRLAYVEEAERRMNSPGSPNGNLLGDIRRELDMQDWDSAQYLIDRAKGKDLSDQDKAELRSMQRYLHTQRALAPQDGVSENASANEKFTDADKAILELNRLSPSVFRATKKAAKRSPETVAALGSIMYNRCWCHKHKYLDEEIEKDMQERAAVETKDNIKAAHNNRHEVNDVSIHGEAASRKFDGHWDSQTLFMGDDPASEDAIVQECDEQKNNYPFKYWTNLIPKGLSYDRHRYIVFNLFPRIKRGLRARGDAYNFDDAIASGEVQEAIQSVAAKDEKPAPKKKAPPPPVMPAAKEKPKKGSSAAEVPAAMSA